MADGDSWAILDALVDASSGGEIPIEGRFGGVSFVGTIRLSAQLQPATPPASPAASPEGICPDRNGAV